MAKPTKPKKIAYELIARQSDRGRPMYAKLDEVLELHHAEIHNEGVRVALAWAKSWKADVDGRLVLGKCKKASDLDREFAPFDFVVLLNKEFWESVKVTDAQRLALLDHELCHAAVVHDQNGEVKEDERGRPVFRLRKHDIEEFRDVVARHGFYKQDLVDFYAAFSKAERDSAGTWVGYTALQRLLAEIGLALGIEQIAQWTPAERMEVQVWARMHRDLEPEKRVSVALATSKPAILAVALGEPAPDQPPATH